MTLKQLDTTTYIVEHNKNFKISSAKTTTDSHFKDTELLAELKKTRKQIAKSQQKLYAENKQALLVVFQAMDAAGKDSTIRHVFKGINPQGCQVHSFKTPSKEELGHDFLWRSAIKLPKRGHITVFNRSYYEETLVVRVNPGLLNAQNLLIDNNDPEQLNRLWASRYQSIRDHERHLVESGTHILKFWLNISPEEQKQRQLARLNTAKKRWKFSADDLDKREQWADYMQAYEAMLNATSTGSAPWYAIPADDKPMMRLLVAQIIAAKLRQMAPQFPENNLTQEHIELCKQRLMHTITTND